MSATCPWGCGASPSTRPTAPRALSPDGLDHLQPQRPRQRGGAALPCRRGLVLRRAATVGESTYTHSKTGEDKRCNTRCLAATPRCSTPRAGIFRHEVPPGSLKLDARMLHKAGTTSPISSQSRCQRGLSKDIRNLWGPLIGRRCKSPPTVAASAWSRQGRGQVDGASLGPALSSTPLFGVEHDTPVLEHILWHQHPMGAVSIHLQPDGPRRQL